MNETPKHCSHSEEPWPPSDVGAGNLTPGRVFRSQQGEILCGCEAGPFLIEIALDQRGPLYLSLTFPHLQWVLQSGQFQTEACECGE